MTPARTAKREIPLDVARKVAQRLVEALAPSCEQIEIAGSIRRGRDVIGDIELVAIPSVAVLPSLQQIGLFDDQVTTTPGSTFNRLNAHLEQLIDSGKLLKEPPRGSAAKPAWGERYKKLWVPLGDPWGFVQLDLFLATQENWGAIFAIRTGSAAFSNALVTYIKHQTPYRQQDGNLIYKPTGEVVPVPTERAYFQRVCVPWVEPEQRTNRAASKLYGRRWPQQVRYTDSDVRHIFGSGSMSGAE